MLDRCVKVLFAVLLLAVTLPLLAWYLLLSGIDSACTAIRRRASRNRNRLGSLRTGRLTKQFAGEFAFDRAIEAYEYLIDSTYAERSQ